MHCFVAITRMFGSRAQCPVRFRTCQSPHAPVVFDFTVLYITPDGCNFPAGLRPTAQMHLHASCPLQGFLHHIWFSKKEASCISFPAHSWLTGLGLRLGPDAPATTALGVLVLDGPVVVAPSGAPVDEQLIVCNTDIPVHLGCNL